MQQLELLATKRLEEVQSLNALLNEIKSLKGRQIQLTLTNKLSNSSQRKLLHESTSQFTLEKQIDLLKKKLSRQIVNSKKSEQIREHQEKEIIESFYHIQYFNISDKKEFEQMSLKIMKRICQGFSFMENELEGSINSIVVLYTRFFISIEQKKQATEIERMFKNNLCSKFSFVCLLMNWLVEITRKLLRDFLIRYKEEITQQKQQALTFCNYKDQGAIKDEKQSECNQIQIRQAEQTTTCDNNNNDNIKESDLEQKYIIIQGRDNDNKLNKQRFIRCISPDNKLHFDEQNSINDIYSPQQQFNNLGKSIQILQSKAALISRNQDVAFYNNNYQNNKINNNSKIKGEPFNRLNCLSPGKNISNISNSYSITDSSYQNLPPNSLIGIRDSSMNDIFNLGQLCQFYGLNKPINKLFIQTQNEKLSQIFSIQNSNSSSCCPTSNSINCGSSQNIIQALPLIIKDMFTNFFPQIMKEFKRHQEVIADIDMSFPLVIKGKKTMQRKIEWLEFNYVSLLKAQINKNVSINLSIKSFRNVKIPKNVEIYVTQQKNLEQESTNYGQKLSQFKPILPQSPILNTFANFRKSKQIERQEQQIIKIFPKEYKKESSETCNVKAYSEHLLPFESNLSKPWRPPFSCDFSEEITSNSNLVSPLSFLNQQIPKSRLPSVERKKLKKQSQQQSQSLIQESNSIEQRTTKNIIFSSKENQAQTNDKSVDNYDQNLLTSNKFKQLPTIYNQSSPLKLKNMHLLNIENLHANPTFLQNKIIITKKPKEENGKKNQISRKQATGMERNSQSTNQSNNKNQEQNILQIPTCNQMSTKDIEIGENYGIDLQKSESDDRNSMIGHINGTYSSKEEDPNTRITNFSNNNNSNINNKRSKSSCKSPHPTNNYTPLSDLITAFYSLPKRRMSSCYSKGNDKTQLSESTNFQRSPNNQQLLKKQSSDAILRQSITDDCFRQDDSKNSQKSTFEKEILPKDKQILFKIQQRKEKKILSMQLNSLNEIVPNNIINSSDLDIIRKSSDKRVKLESKKNNNNNKSIEIKLMIDSLKLLKEEQEEEAILTCKNKPKKTKNNQQLYQELRKKVINQISLHQNSLSQNQQSDSYQNRKSTSQYSDNQTKSPSLSVNQKNQQTKESISLLDFQLNEKPITSKGSKNKNKINDILKQSTQQMCEYLKLAYKQRDKSLTCGQNKLISLFPLIKTSE